MQRCMRQFPTERCAYLGVELLRELYRKIELCIRILQVDAYFNTRQMLIGYVSDPLFDL